MGARRPDHDSGRFDLPKRLVLTLAILGLIAVSAVVPVEASMTITIDGNLPDGGDCATIGVWDGATGNCDVDDLVLGQGDLLTVESGRLWVRGRLNSLGAQIENLDKLRISGLFVNAGELHNHPGALFETWWESGPSAPRMENRGTIVNDGDFHNWDAFVRNEPTGLIRGAGSITQYGTTGALRNSGTMLVEGLLFPIEQLFENLADGTLIIESGAGVWLDSFGQFINRGRMDNHDDIYGFNWTLDNYGTINNYTFISTCDEYQINGTTISNHGTLNQFGTIYNCATIDNYGTLVNSGDIQGRNEEPAVINNSGTIVDCGSITCNVTGNPVIPDVDGDSDGFCNLADCAVGDAAVWRVPGAARALRLSHAGGTGGVTNLDWVPPMYPGGSLPRYDVVSSADPGDFVSGPLTGCVETDDAADATAADPLTPWPPHTVSYYLVRPGNPCGEGSAGISSSDELRTLRACP